MDLVHQRASQRGLLWCPASPPCSASRDSSEERRWRRSRRFRRVCRGLDGSHASAVLSEASSVVTVARVESQSVNKIVAGQLALRARTMTNAELEQLFESLLDAKTDGAGERASAADNESDGTTGSSSGTEGAVQFPAGQTYGFDPETSASLPLPETSARGEAEGEAREEASDFLQSILPSATPSLDSGDVAASWPVGSGGDDPEVVSTLSSARTFVESHLVSFELAAASVVAAAVLALTSKFLGSIFSPEGSSEAAAQGDGEGTGYGDDDDGYGDRGRSMEREVVFEREGSPRMDPSPSFAGPVSGEGRPRGGVVWSRSEPPAAATAASAARTRSDTVLWTRQDTEEEEEEEEEYSPTHRALEDNVE